MTLTMLLRLAFISMFLISQLVLPGVGVGLAQHASGNRLCDTSCTMHRHADHADVASIPATSASDATAPMPCCRFMSSSCDMDSPYRTAPASTPTPSAHTTCLCSIAPVDLPTPEPIAPALPTLTGHTLAMLLPRLDPLASSIMAKQPHAQNLIESELHTLLMRSHNASQASLGLWLT